MEPEAIPHDARNSAGCRSPRRHELSHGVPVGAWGHDFVVTPFEPMQLMVAIATDKATGKQFNIIKMPDGYVMAVVPFDQMAKMPEIAPNSLMPMKMGR